MAQMESDEGATEVDRGSTCEVCLELYEVTTSAERTPRSLPCGHTFCTACLVSLEAYSPERGRFQCPRCKFVVGLQDRGFASDDSEAHLVHQALPKNFELISLMQSKNSRAAVAAAAAQQQQSLPQAAQAAERGNICEEHNEIQRIFCFECEVAICMYCQMHGEHRFHKCAVDDVALDLLKERLSLTENEVDAKCNAQHDSLAHAVEQSRTRTGSLEQFGQATLHTVKTALAHLDTVGRGIVQEVEDMLNQSKVETAQLSGLDDENKEKWLMSKELCQAATARLASIKESQCQSGAKLEACVDALADWGKAISLVADCRWADDAAANGLVSSLNLDIIKKKLHAFSTLPQLYEQACRYKPKPVVVHLLEDQGDSEAEAVPSAPIAEIHDGAVLADRSLGKRSATAQQRLEDSMDGHPAISALPPAKRQRMEAPAS